MLKKLENLSKILLRPVLYSISMIAIDVWIDIYEFFRFELVHAFLLHTSNLLKRCLIRYRADAYRRSHYMAAQENITRTFGQIRRLFSNILIDTWKIL